MRFVPPNPWFLTPVQSAAVAMLTTVSVLPEITRAADGRAAPGRPFLWHATHPDVPGTLYLLGSLHVSSPDLYPMPPAVERAYAMAHTLVFETDIGLTSSPEFGTRVAALARFPEDESLQDAVSPEVFALLREQAEKRAFPLAYVMQYRPWYCANYLTMTVLRRLGYNQSEGIDRHFHLRAVQDEKRIVSLEEADFQLALFSGLSPEDAEDFLRQTLTDVRHIEDFAPQLVAAWKTGDAEGLGALIEGSFEPYPHLYRRWLIDRNRAWIPQLTELAGQEGDVLVVVGAGHLVGKQSVLRMLQAEGFSVEQAERE